MSSATITTEKEDFEQDQYDLAVDKAREAIDAFVMEWSIDSRSELGRILLPRDEEIQNLIRNGARG